MKKIDEESIYNTYDLNLVNAEVIEEVNKLGESTQLDLDTITIKQLTESPVSLELNERGELQSVTDEGDIVIYKRNLPELIEHILYILVLLNLSICKPVLSLFQKCNLESNFLIDFNNCFTFIWLYNLI